MLNPPAKRSRICRTTRNYYPNAIGCRSDDYVQQRPGLLLPAHCGPLSDASDFEVGEVLADRRILEKEDSSAMDLIQQRLVAIRRCGLLMI
jgi:hypothetical protein